MNNIFSYSEQLITAYIYKFALYPTSILAGGVSILGATALGIWGLYRGYLIMAGLVSTPLASFFKDLMVKVAVLAMAGSASFYGDNIYEPLIYSQQELATEMAQGTNKTDSKSIFTGLENNLADIGTLLEGYVAETNKGKSNVELRTEEEGELGFWAWAWESTKDLGASAAETVETVGNLMANFLHVLKLLMVALGLMILGAAAFLTIIINKVFFMISLGMAPLFLMFLAFESTRGWFMSWLNTTLGYCLAYPLIAFVIGVLMEIYDNLFSLSTALSFTSAFVLLTGSIVFAVITARLGDLASSYFSAGNIADGTALAVGMAARAMGKKTAGAAGKTASGGGKVAKSARDKYQKRKSSISEG